MIGYLLEADMAKKRYNVFVQFDAQDMPIMANNKREAVRLVKEKLKTTPAYKLLDKRNLFVDER
jgi:hypothetical protein